MQYLNSGATQYLSFLGQRVQLKIRLVARIDHPSVRWDEMYLHDGAITAGYLEVVGHIRLPPGQAHHRRPQKDVLGTTLWISDLQGDDILVLRLTAPTKTLDADL